MMSPKKLTRSKQNIILQWYNALTIVSKAETLKDFTDGQHFLNLAQKIKNKLSYIQSQDNESDIDKRYACVEETINNLFNVKSENLLDFHSCKNGIVYELSKVAVILLSVITKKMLDDKDPNLTILYELDPETQDNIRIWMCSVLMSDGKESHPILSPDFADSLCSGKHKEMKTASKYTGTRDNRYKLRGHHETESSLLPLHIYFTTKLQNLVWMELQQLSEEPQEMVEDESVAVAEDQNPTESNETCSNSDVIVESVVEIRGSWPEIEVAEIVIGNVLDTIAGNEECPADETIGDVEMIPEEIEETSSKEEAITQDFEQTSQEEEAITLDFEQTSREEKAISQDVEETSSEEEAITEDLQETSKVTQSDAKASEEQSLNVVPEIQVLPPEEANGQEPIKDGECEAEPVHGTNVVGNQEVKVEPGPGTISDRVKSSVPTVVGRVRRGRSNLVIPSTEMQTGKGNEANASAAAIMPPTKRGRPKKEKPAANDRPTKAKPAPDVTKDIQACLTTERKRTLRRGTTEAAKVKTHLIMIGNSPLQTEEGSGRKRRVSGANKVSQIKPEPVQTSSRKRKSPTLLTYECSPSRRRNIPVRYLGSIPVTPKSAPQYPLISFSSRGTPERKKKSPESIQTSPVSKNKTSLDEFKVLKEELERTTNDTVSLKAEMEKIRNQNIALQNELKVSRTITSERLKEMNHQLYNKDGRIKHLHLQINHLQQELTNRTSTLEMTRKNGEAISHRTQKLEEQQKLYLEEKNALNLAIEELREKKQQLEAKLTAKLESSNAINNRLLKANADLMKSNDSVLEEIKLKEEIQQKLESEIESLKVAMMTESVKEMQSPAPDLTAELNMLKQELAERDDLLQTSELAVEELHAKIKQSSDELDACKKSKEQVSQENEDLIKTKESLMVDIRVKEDNCLKLEAEIAVLNAESQADEIDFNEMKDSLELCNVEVNRLIQELAEKNELLQTKNLALEDLTSKLDQLTSELELCKTVANSNEGQMAALSEQLESSKLSVAEFVSRAEVSAAELELCKSELVKAKTSKACLSRKLLIAKRHAEKAEGECQKAEAEVETLKDKIILIENELNKEKKKYCEMKKKYGLASTEVYKLKEQNDILKMGLSDDEELPGPTHFNKRLVSECHSPTASEEAFCNDVSPAKKKRSIVLHSNGKLRDGHEKDGPSYLNDVAQYNESESSSNSEISLESGSDPDSDWNQPKFCDMAIYLNHEQLYKDGKKVYNPFPPSGRGHPTIPPFKHYSNQELEARRKLAKLQKNPEQIKKEDTEIWDLSNPDNVVNIREPGRSIFELIQNRGKPIPPTKLDEKGYRPLLGYL